MLAYSYWRCSRLSIALAATRAGPIQASQSENRQRQESSSRRARGSHYGSEGLPAPVREMREAMLSAVKSGRIEELRHAYELNELKPDLGVPAVKADPVAHWKQISGDGEGREVLAALSLILEAGYVVLPLGRDIENNRVYIWPYFAEVPLETLTASTGSRTAATWYRPQRRGI